MVIGAQRTNYAAAHAGAVVAASLDGGPRVYVGRDASLAVFYVGIVMAVLYLAIEIPGNSAIICLVAKAATLVDHHIGHLSPHRGEQAILAL